MIKRLISVLLLMTMLFTLFPVEVMAAVADNISTARQGVKLENPFADVRQGSWYYDTVQYARVNGFFSGTAANTFAPDGTMSRGMFVTVLGRMAGMEQAAYTGQPAFRDVAADAYYAPFVAWALKHGIAAGVGDGKFDPNGLINREQMAVFLVRYFEAFGVDYDTGATITTVPADLDTVSPWAREMVLKLWKTGLLSGDGVSFRPADNASRAQAATLCMRTDQAVETWYREPGVPSERVSVDPSAEQNPDASTDGGSNTSNYTVKHCKQTLDGTYALEETEGKFGATGQSTAAVAKTYEGFTAQAVSQQTIAADGSTVVEIQYTRNSYTVLYDGNGNGSDGGSMAAQTFRYGETKTLTTSSFTKTGYIFSGWNTEEDGTGTSYVDEASVTNLTAVADGTVILYAQWMSNTCTVTFDSNKGSGSSQPSVPSPASMIATRGTNYGSLATVSRAGYTFAGWYTAVIGGTEVMSTTQVTSNVNHTLFARWTANSYAVEFNGNGSTGGTMVNQPFTYDMTKALTANSFTKTGYIFSGWNTEEDGTGTSYTDGASVTNLTAVASGTVTLYAQWTADIYDAEIGKAGYTTLQEAVDAVTDGQTVKLRKDITLAASVSFSGTKSFTLDLNGKTLDGAANAAISHNGSGTLTIRDSAVGGGGTVTSATDHTDYVGTISLGSTGSLVVAGGTVKNTALNPENTGAPRAAIGSNGTGTIRISGGLVQSNGVAINNCSTGGVNVSDGTVKSIETMAIHNRDIGKITISGTAKITSEDNYATIYLEKGAETDTVLEITGGRIENTGKNGVAIRRAEAASGKISIPRGSPAIKGSAMAMNVAPDLSGYAKLQITASKDIYVVEIVPYSAVDIATYKYLTFSAYDVWVGGVEVTDANAADITGVNISGTVSYDAATNTLTLNNADISGSYGAMNAGWTSNGDPAAIFSDSNLIINLVGTNTVTNLGKVNAEKIFGIYVLSRLTITGNGTLAVSTENATASKINYAICMGLYGAHFVISNGATVVARAGAVTNASGESYGIVARSGGGTLYGVALKGTLEASGHTAALLVSRVEAYHSSNMLTFTGVSTEYGGELASTTEHATKENCAKYRNIKIVNP